MLRAKVLVGKPHWWLVCVAAVKSHRRGGRAWIESRVIVGLRKLSRVVEVLRVLVGRECLLGIVLRQARTVGLSRNIGIEVLGYRPWLLSEGVPNRGRAVEKCGVEISLKGLAILQGVGYCKGLNAVEIAVLLIVCMLCAVHGRVGGWIHSEHAG